MGITGFITKILKRDYKQTSYLIISLTISFIIVFNIFNICTIDIMQANNMQENIVLGIIILSVTAVSMFLGCYLNQVFLERRRSEMAMQMVCGVSIGEILGGVLFQTLIISGISIILGFGIGFLISPIFNNLVYSMLGVSGSPYFISMKGLVVSLVIIFMQIIVIIMINISICYRNELVNLVKSSGNNYIPKRKINRFLSILTIISLLAPIIVFFIRENRSKEEMFTILTFLSQYTSLALVLVIGFTIPWIIEILSKSKFGVNKICVVVVRNFSYMLEKSVPIVIAYILIVQGYFVVAISKQSDPKAVVMGQIGFGLVLILLAISLGFKVVYEAIRRKSSFKNLYLLGYKKFEIMKLINLEMILYYLLLIILPTVEYGSIMINYIQLGVLNGSSMVVFLSAYVLLGTGVILISTILYRNIIKELIA